MTNLNDLAKRRQPNREAVEAQKKRMLAQTRAYRLREIREQFDMTQVELAHQLDVSQNRVSAIERGDIDKTQVDTLRRYVEALGGQLEVAVSFGDESGSSESRV